MTQTTTAPKTLPNIHKTVLTVFEKNYITPNYLSITFKTQDVSLFENVLLGEHNKIFIPNEGETEISIPTFDFAKSKWVTETGDVPTVRTYTHRAIDLVNQTMTIDFAVHTGTSAACNWAINANVGDELAMLMKQVSKKILPDNKKNYIFVADPTAIPVTAVYLEALPKESNAIVIVEVPTLDDHYPFTSQANLDITWLYNPHPEQGSQLAQTLKTHPALSTLTDNRFAHIAAEFATVRQARDILRKTHDWTREECFACAYWRIGKKEGESTEKPELTD